MNDDSVLQPIQPIESPSGQKRYFYFLGNPKWYIWGLVAVLTIVAVYITLAVQRNLWPFQIEKPIIRSTK